MSNIPTLLDFRNISNQAEQLVTLRGNEQSTMLSSVEKASVLDMADLKQDSVLSALKQALLSDRNYRGMSQTISKLLDDIRAEVTAAPKEMAVTGRDIQRIMSMVDSLTVAASLETRIMAEKDKHKAPGPNDPARQTLFETELQNAYITKAQDLLKKDEAISSISIDFLARVISEEWQAKDALVESRINSLSPESMERLRQWHKHGSCSLDQLAEKMSQITWIDKSHLLPEDKNALYKACYDDGNTLERHDFFQMLTAAKDKAFPILTQKWEKNNLSKENLQLLLDKGHLFAQSPKVESRVIKALQYIEKSRLSEPLKRNLRALTFTEQMLKTSNLDSQMDSMVRKHALIEFINFSGKMHKVAAESSRNAIKGSQLLNRETQFDSLEKELAPLAKNPEISPEALHDKFSQCSKLMDMLPSLNSKDMGKVFEVVCDPKKHIGEAVQQVVSRVTHLRALYSKLDPAMASHVDLRGYSNIVHDADTSEAVPIPGLERLEQRIDMFLKMQDLNISPDKAACLYNLLDKQYYLLSAQEFRTTSDTAIGNMAELQAAQLPDYLSYAVFDDTLRSDISMDNTTFIKNMRETIQFFNEHQDIILRNSDPWSTALKG